MKGNTAPRPVGPVGRLRNYFLAGLLVTAPVSITFWLAWQVIGFIDDRVTPLIPPKWNPETYLPFSLPGIGLVAAFIFLTLVGAVAAGFVGRSTMRWGESMLARVPVVRSIYSAVKQIFETVLASRSTAFREVALIEYPCRGTWAVGFITGQTVGEVQRKTESTVINVFIPATPNPTTGFLLFVPQRDVHLLDMSVEDGIKLVISGGIVTPPAEGQEEGDDHQPSAVSLRADSAKKAAAKLRRKAAKTKRSKKEKAQKPFGLMARIRNYFLAGVLVTAPISITIWLAWKFVSFVDAKVTPFIPPFWNPETYLPFGVPGLGLVVVVFGLVIVGMLTAGFTGRLLMRTGERLLARLPVISNIYSALKQIFETVLAQQSTAFRQVCLIQYPRPEVWAIGFVTGTSEGHVQGVTASTTVNVFLPTTPNPTSGFLLFLPQEEVMLLKMTVEEGLKMVVSGGIVTPPDPRDDLDTGQIADIYRVESDARTSEKELVDGG